PSDVPTSSERSTSGVGECAHPAVISGRLELGSAEDPLGRVERARRQRLGLLRALALALGGRRGLLRLLADDRRTRGDGCAGRGHADGCGHRRLLPPQLLLVVPRAQPARTRGIGAIGDAAGLRLAPGTSATALGRLGAGDRADRGRREVEPLELEGSGEALLNSNRDPFGQGTSQTLTKSAKSSVQAASSLLDGHGVPRIPEWTNRVLPASRTSRGPLPCREGRH